VAQENERFRRDDNGEQAPEGPTDLRDFVDDAGRGVESLASASELANRMQSRSAACCGWLADSRLRPAWASLIRVARRDD
jgi:hypothetical protein